MGTRTNLTILMLANQQKIGVEEEGKEATRMVTEFLKKVRMADKQDVEGDGDREPLWLEFTNPKREGSRSLYLREEQVASIQIINEVVIEEPSKLDIARLEPADPFSRQQ